MTTWMNVTEQDENATEREETSIDLRKYYEELQIQHRLSKIDRIRKDAAGWITTLR